VRIWQPATGHTSVVYRGHRGWVDAIDWSPDGTRIASGSDDHTVQVWRAR
jgi:WD40 repeat protein